MLEVEHSLQVEKSVYSPDEQEILTLIQELKDGIYTTDQALFLNTVFWYDTKQVRSSLERLFSLYNNEKGNQALQQSIKSFLNTLKTIDVQIAQGDIQSIDLDKLEQSFNGLEQLLDSTYQKLSGWEKFYSIGKVLLGATLILASIVVIFSPFLVMATLAPWAFALCITSGCIFGFILGLKGVQVAENNINKLVDNRRSYLRENIFEGYKNAVKQHFFKEPEMLEKEKVSKDNQAVVELV